MEPIQPKVVFLGPAAVGKTCLVTRILTNSFEPHSLSTITPSFICKPITLDSGVTVELQLWDTAGQERFQAISRSFYRGAHIAVVCHDVDLTSLASWAQRARDSDPNCAIFMVLTKADVYTSDEVNDASDRAKEIGKPFNARHYITSAKSGVGMDSLVPALAEVGNETFRREFHSEVQDAVALEKPLDGGDNCC
jgi:small GTP-binding protein